MLLTLAFAISIVQQGSTAEEKNNYRGPESLSHAIADGKWARVTELLGEIKAENRKFPVGSIAGLMNGRIASDTYYANILTGIRLLNEAGDNVNAVNGYALFLAAGGDKHGQIIERLLQYGADPNRPYFNPDYNNAKGNEGIPPLGEAIIDTNVKLLLKYGAKPNVFFPFESGYRPVFKGHVTPLIRSVIIGPRPSVTKLLLDGKANPNLKCPENGMTALHFAAQYNFDTLIPVLLKAKADKKLKDKNGRTPLALARKYKSVKAIKMLGG